MQPAVKESNLKPALNAKKFEFMRDTFAFANELHWEYRIDAEGKTTIFKNNPSPTYAHHCFVVVRAAKQFFLHAKFDVSLPKLNDAEYAQRVRDLMHRSAEHEAATKIIIPGFASLREFTAAYKMLAQENCGGSWQSYVQRGNWRMVFPFTRTHQEREAKKLLSRIDDLPIVHVVQFPVIKINHGIMLFDAVDSEDQVEFRAYDPNIIDRPVSLFFDKARRTFTFPRNHYFAGGELNVYQIYNGFFF